MTGSDSPGTLRVAYTMSRFPKLTETFVLNEILEMRRQGVDVSVFPLWREHTTRIHSEAEDIAAIAHYLPTLNLEITRDVCYWLFTRPNRLLSTLWKLLSENSSSLRYLVGGLAVFPKCCTMARRMQRLRIDHLHAHFASHPAAAAFVIHRLTGIPFSFTAHGSDLHRTQAMLASKVREAKFVIAISEYNRRFIVGKVGAAIARNVQVIHCGVETDRLLPATSPSSDLIEIVCTGTLHEVKGQKFLIAACADLERSDIDWRCHLIGDGPDRTELERLAVRLGIRERVEFHGSLTSDRVAAILGRGSIACAPSVPTADGRREGIPVALMEAGACGLPLVASRLSGIPEIVIDGETGLLTEPGNPAELAAALLRLARSPEERARFGSAARQIVRERFSLDSSVGKIRHCIASGMPTCSH